MTSEGVAYVWAFLPGETQPTLCGRLEHPGAAGARPAGGVGRFVYGKSYLANPAAQPLDPVALALQPRVFEATGAHQGVFGVFADACPDDWGRYVIERRHGVQAYPIGYLLLSQEDRVGHLCFSRTPDEAPELTPPTPRSLLDEAWLVVTGLNAGRRVAAELEHRIRANTALGGARPKLTVADDRCQWLAKFPSRRDDPRLPLARIEAAMLDLARACGIDAAQAEIHAVAPEDGSPGGDILLVRRFDRSLATRSQPGSPPWLRDAYASARTVLLSDEPSAHASYAGSYARLARELQRWSARAPTDRLELYRRMVFNCCISNTDDHDRNHGFVASEDGLGFRLAPAFDMVPQRHGTVRRYQAMNIGDHGAEPTVQNLLSAAPAFQIGQARAREIIDEVQTLVLQEWREALHRRGVEEAAMDLLEPCFAALHETFDELSIPGPRFSW